jgi:hypothetical protein
MALETQEKQIGDQTVYVTPFVARKSLSILHKLSSKLGPAIGELVKGADTKEGLTLGSNFDLSVISPALEKLFTQLPEKEFMELVKDLLLSTRVGAFDVSVPQNFDVVFSQKFLFLFKVLAFVVQVNFSDFFEDTGIGSIFMKMRSQQPPISTQDSQTN